MQLVTDVRVMRMGDLMSWFWFSIGHPWSFGVCCLLVLAAALVGWRRRVAINWVAATLCVVGMVVLAQAAGGL